jgi:antitoxin component of MazEF toxin-antitoxin module
LAQDALMELLVQKWGNSAALRLPPECSAS